MQQETIDYLYHQPTLRPNLAMGRIEGPLTPEQNVRFERLLESLKLRAHKPFNMDRLHTYARRATWR
jgi:hypothetical protein